MKQLLAIVLVFAFVVALPGAALAQDAAPGLPPPFCGDLADADCQLLADSQAAMQSVTSLTADVQIDMLLSSVPELPDLPLQFAMNAVIHSDPTITLAIQELAADPPEDPAELQAAMRDWVLDFYGALAFDMEMTISLPDLLAEQIGAEEGIEFPSVIRLPMRFVDGMLYMDLQPLASAIPDLQADLDDEGVTGWIGFDYIGLLEEALAQDNQLGETQADNSMEFGMGMGMMMNSPEVRDWYGEFAEIQRLPDAELDGAPQAVFETSVDLGKLLMSREFQKNLRQLLEQSATASGEELDRQELGQTLRPRVLVHADNRPGYALYDCQRCEADHRSRRHHPVAGDGGRAAWPGMAGRRAGVRLHTALHVRRLQRGAGRRAARRRLHDPAG